MHIHVLGLGPVGCLLAYNLRRLLPPAHSISLIHKSKENRLLFLQGGPISVERSGHVEKSEGNFLHETFYGRGSSPFRPKTPDDVEQASPIETIFVALKAQHTASALDRLSRRITPNSTVVLLQNGMGVYEELLNKVFRNPSQRPNFVIATNTHGVFFANSCHVVHAGLGTINFGIPPTRGRDFERGLHDPNIPIEQRRLRLLDITRSLDPDFQKYKTLRETVALFLLAKSLNVSWVPFPDLRLALKRKVVTNAVINPLTAIMGCRNGDLFSHPPAVDILSQVCSEASSIFAAQHRYEIALRLEQLESQGTDTSNLDIPSMPSELSKESLEANVNLIALRTQGNISSMLQDLRRGRTTEIDYINGYLERLGRELGIETPTISMLKNLVKLKGQIPQGML